MSTNTSAKSFVINFEGDTELLDKALKRVKTEAENLGGTLTSSFIRSSADGQKFTAQVEILLGKFKSLKEVQKQLSSGEGLNFSSLAKGNFNVSLSSLKLNPLADVKKDLDSLRITAAQRLSQIRNSVTTELLVYKEGVQSLKAIRKEGKDAVLKLEAEYAKKTEAILNNSAPLALKQGALLAAETKFRKDLLKIQQDFADKELASIKADKAIKAKELQLKNFLQAQEASLAASLKRQTALLTYGGNSQKYFEARKTSNLDKLSAQKDYLISQVNARNLPTSQRLSEIAKINTEYESLVKKVIAQYNLATDTLKRQADQAKTTAQATKDAAERKIAAEREFQKTLTTTEKLKLAEGRIAVARAGVASSPDSISKVNALRDAELAYARTETKLKIAAIKAAETSTTRQADLVNVAREFVRVQKSINTNRDADISRIKLAQDSQKEYNRYVAETTKRLGEASAARLKLNAPTTGGSLIQETEAAKAQKLLALQVKAQEQLNALKDQYNQKLISGSQYLSEQEKTYNRLERNTARVTSAYNSRLQTLSEIHVAEKKVESALHLQEKEQLRLNALKEKTIWGKLTADKPVTVAPDPFLRLTDPKGYIAQANAFADYVKKSNVNLNTFGNTYAQWMGKVITSIGLYQILYNSLNKISQAIHNIPDSGIRLEASQATLTATLKSYSAMQQEMQVFRKEAERTGIPITTIRKGFDQLAPSAMMAGESVATVNEILKNMNTVTTTLHKSEDAVQGIYLAFSQMFSKNKVQAEELVKQLSQRIPGAVPAMAKAYGRITGETEDLTNKLQKAMKKGLVEPHKLLLEFTKVLEEAYGGDAFARATEGLNANIGRLKTQYEELSNSVYLATSKMMIDTLKSLTGGIAGLNEYAKNTEQLRLDILNLIETIKTLAITAIGGLFLSKTFAMVGAFTSLRTALAANTSSLQKFSNFLNGTSGTFENVKRNALGAISAITSNLAVMATAAVIGFSLIDDELAKIENRRKSMQEANEETERWLNSIKAKETGDTPYQIENDPRVRSQQFAIEKAQEDLRKFQEQWKFWQDPFNIGQTSPILNALYGEEFEAELAQKQATLERYLKNKEEAVKAVAKEIKTQNELTAEGIDKIIPDETFEKAKDFYKFLQDISESQLNIDRSLSDRKTSEIDSQIKQLQLQMRADQTNLQLKYDLTAKIGDLEIAKQQEALKLSREQLGLRKEAVQTISQETSGTDVKSLISAITQWESSGVKNRARAVSPVGALGAGQVMPFNLTGNWGGIDLKPPAWLLERTKGGVASKIRPFTASEKQMAADWAESQAEGINKVRDLMIQKLFEKYKDPVKTMIAYNAGEKWVSTYEKGGTLPKETQGYIPGVLKILNSKSSAASDFLSINEKIVSSETDLYQKTLGLQDLEAQKAANLQEIQAEIRKTKEEQLTVQQQQVSLLQEEIEGLTGGKASKQTAQVEIDYLKKRKEYLADTSGKNTRPENTKALELLETWRSIKLQAAEVVDIQSNFAKVQETYNAREQSISQQKQIGILNEVTAMKELLKARQEYNQEATILLDKLDAIAEKTKDQELATSTAKSRLEVKTTTGTYTTGTKDYLASKNPNYQTFQKDSAQIEADYQNNISVLSQDSTLSLEEKQSKQLEIESETFNAKFQIHSAYYASIAGVASSAFESMTKHAVAAYGAQSKAARKYFLLYKASKIAEITMSTASSVMAQLTIPYVGWALAALVAAMGAVQIAQVASQQMPSAHAGLEYVPEDATYVLKKGERVLAPNQNKALTEALNTNRLSNTPQTTSANVKIINVGYGEDFKKYLTSAEGEQIIVNHQTANSGAF